MQASMSVWCTVISSFLCTVKNATLPRADALRSTTFCFQITSVRDEKANQIHGVETALAPCVSSQPGIGCSLHVCQTIASLDVDAQLRGPRAPERPDGEPRLPNGLAAGALRACGLRRADAESA